MLLAITVCLTSSFGCIGNSNLIKNKYPATRVPPGIQVSVTPWLSESTSVTLSPESATLQNVLQNPIISSYRNQLLLANLQLRQRHNTGEFLFEDNVATISRHDEIWYFLEPIQLLELYAGNVPVKNNDHVETIPFRMSMFGNSRSNFAFEYGLLESGLPIQKIRVQPGSLEASLSLFLAGISSQHQPHENWTVTIIHRQNGSIWHRLVIPANLSNNRMNAALRALEVLTASNAAELMPNDIVEKSNWIEMKRKLE